MHSYKKLFGGVALCAVLILGQHARAGDLSVTLSDTDGREATALFSVSGSDLIVTLTNSSSSDVMVPVDVLTGVFFNSSVDITGMSKDSAVVGPTSTVHFDSDDTVGAGDSVASEWAYRDDLSQGFSGTTVQYGISSTGLGLFADGDRFDLSSPSLDDPDAPNGLNYGILSAGDDITTGNQKVTGGGSNEVPLIKNAVVFTLGGVGAGFDPMTQLSDVVFQYGTDLSEPHLPPNGDHPNGEIPEPVTATLSLIAIGAVGLGSLRRRRA